MKGLGPSHLAPQGPQKLLAVLEQQAQRHPAKRGPRSPPPPLPREPGAGGWGGPCWEGSKQPSQAWPVRGPRR